MAHHHDHEHERDHGAGQDDVHDLRFVRRVADLARLGIAARQRFRAK